MSYVGVTGELGEESKYVWKIANFFSLSAMKNSYYTSSSFVFNNTSLHLRIYPAGDTNSESGFLSVYLENENEDPIHVNITLQIKKADGTMTGGGTGDVCLELTRGYANFYMRSSLQQRQFEMVPSGILTIVCILKPNHDGKQKIIKDEKIENSHGKQTNKILDNRKLTELDVLSDNLKDLSTNKDSCDTVLQVKDKEFKAHKTILMARSPVFAAMFQHDTLEKQTGFIDIPDCDPESFPEFLAYIYCGKLDDISYHSAFQLYITSNKYDVQKLKEYCVEYLIESLTADNMCDIVKLADQYDDEKLMLSVQEFFNENWDKIFITTQWQNLLKKEFRLGNKLLIGMSKAKTSQ